MLHDPTVLPIKSFLDEAPPGDALGEATLRRCLNETWFSDTLAWLLDPRGSHGFGVSFVNAFVKRVGMRRSEAGGGYERRETHLKYGKAGRGVGTASFNFGNAASLREFFLARGRGRRGRGQQYCDVVVLDLDSGDDFLMVIENKLFTINRPGQLQGYLETVEARYSRVKVREYVFLTLDGRAPEAFPEVEDPRTYERWVCLSWAVDVLEILEELNERATEEVTHVVALLRWLRRLLLLDGSRSLRPEEVSAYLHHVLTASAHRLLKELRRLGEGGVGDWSLVKEEASSGRSRPGTRHRQVALVHSATRSRLYVEMLPNFSITAQTRNKRGARFEKIVVPFGAPPDQVFNLLDLGARDIYHGHFDKVSKYLGSAKRLRRKASVRGEAHLDLFKFQYARRFELRVLLMSAREVRDASRWEVEATLEELEVDREEVDA